MSNSREWPADQYAVGSFIQHEFSEQLLQKYQFQFKARDHLLDIGCGEGGYTRELAKKIAHGHLMGIDASHKMIAQAKQSESKSKHISFKVQDALTLADHEKYTVITAFWSLQWMPDNKTVLHNIHRALKPSGRFFAVYPSPHCLHWKLCQRLIESGKFRSLKNFVLPATLLPIEDWQKEADALGFQSFRAEYNHCQLKLPSLDVFRSFVKGIPFFEGQVPDADVPKLNEAMVEAFEQFCNENFEGDYYFSDEMVVLYGVKAPRIIELMPEQRDLLIQANFPRGDLDTPRSQIKNAIGDEAHFESNIKPHEKFANQPTGDDNRLSQQTANNRAAQERANQPELTPSPSAKLQAQAVLQATPQITPKPIPGG
ncbi:MAG: methyltransferase domain-containing protein [Coxiellaceae bacterium]|nr:methyltransferase domain-containing protein [Coxiellaceae bacterium]